MEAEDVQAALWPVRSHRRELTTGTYRADFHFPGFDEDAPKEYVSVRDYFPHDGPLALDLRGSATAFRFFCAAAALRIGDTTLTGDESLRRRPMDDIVHAVRGLGVTVEPTSSPSGMVAPIKVSGGPPKRYEVTVDASRSSHPLSAMLLIGQMNAGLTVNVSGEIASRPYVDMTVFTLAQFGVRVECEANRFHVLHGPYPDIQKYVAIVGDWSSAAFVMGAAAAGGGDVELSRLDFDSPQADRRIVDILRDFGATVDRTPTGVRVRGNDRRPLDVDLRDAPDLAPLVGALGCVASGTTRVRGAAHLRLKESDRIATVVAAARALGCEARELPDGFEIVGPAKHGGLVETKHDHRIAMAFAVAGLAVPGVVIDDPACVAKSYPGFWDDLARLIGVDTEAPR
jgi:3-phosphoshikimate 1-carboxyvinyltransferase